MLLHIIGLQDNFEKKQYDKFVNFSKIEKIIFTDNSNCGKIKALNGHDDEILFSSGQDVHANYKRNIDNCDLVFCWIDNTLTICHSNYLIFELNYAKINKKPILFAAPLLDNFVIDLVKGLDLLGQFNEFIIGISSPEEAFAIYKKQYRNNTITQDAVSTKLETGNSIGRLPGLSQNLISAQNQNNFKQTDTGEQTSEFNTFGNSLITYEKHSNTAVEKKILATNLPITNMSYPPPITTTSSIIPEKNTATNKINLVVNRITTQANPEKQQIITKMLNNTNLRNLQAFPQLGGGALDAITSIKWKNASDIARKAAFALEKEIKTHKFSLEEELSFYYDLAHQTSIKSYLTSLVEKESWWGRYNACKYRMSATKWNIISVLFQDTLIYKTHLLGKEKLAKLILEIEKQNNVNNIENFVYQFIHRRSNNNQPLSFTEQLMGAK